MAQSLLALSVMYSNWRLSWHVPRTCTENAESIHVEAKQAQSGFLENTAHFTIKPMPKLANDPCPQLPEVTVDCGQKAQGSQNQSVTATASTGSQNSPISLYVGLGTTQYGLLDASALLTYGRYGGLVSYDQNKAYGVKVFFKALEF